MDADSNVTAQHFKDLMDKAETKRREGLLKNLDEARQQGLAAQGGTDSLKTLSTKKDESVAKPKARAKSQKPKVPPPNTVTTSYAADKMELAKSGNAFSVASLSKLANRHEPKVEQIGPNEVVINLH